MHTSQVHFDEMIAIPVVLKKPVESQCGWTVVAFRTDPANLSSSLTGFGFNGPVGVDVFRPKHR